MISDFLKDKKVFLFDAFGTLFKINPIDDQLKEIAGYKSNQLLNTWRRKQLEYSWLRNQMKQYVPFNIVTKEALQYAMQRHQLTDQRIPELLLPVYEQPLLNDGALELIQKLYAQQKRIGILSNGTKAMLENGVARTNIEKEISIVLSVDTIGIYKPHPEVYRMALTTLDIEASEVLFCSSNQWDVSGASVFGLDTVWINKNSETKECLPFGKVKEVASLSALGAVL